MHASRCRLVSASRESIRQAPRVRSFLGSGQDGHDLPVQEHTSQRQVTLMARERTAFFDPDLPRHRRQRKNNFESQKEPSPFFASRIQLVVSVQKLTGQIVLGLSAPWASTAGLGLFEGLPATVELVLDGIDGGCPDEGFWVLVPCLQEFCDGGLQVEIREDAAA